jgi:hypothetical protein
VLGALDKSQTKILWGIVEKNESPNPHKTEINGLFNIRFDAKFRKF